MYVHNGEVIDGEEQRKFMIQICAALVDKLKSYYMVHKSLLSLVSRWAGEVEKHGDDEERYLDSNAMRRSSKAGQYFGPENTQRTGCCLAQRIQANNGL